MPRNTRDKIAEMLVPYIPEGEHLAELIHGGSELTLTVVNSQIDLVPAELVTPGSLVLRAFAIVTVQLAGATEDQAVITLYEDAGTPVSLGTIAFADASGDAVGDIRSRTALADGAAANPAAGNKKYYAEVTQATSGTGAAGKARVYIEWVRANTTYD